MANGFHDESFDQVWVLESAHLMRGRHQLIAEYGLAAFERSCQLLSGFWRDGTFGYAIVAASKAP